MGAQCLAGRVWCVRRVLRVCVVLFWSIVTSGANASVPALSDYKAWSERAISIGEARKPQHRDLSYVETYLQNPLEEVSTAIYWSKGRQRLAIKRLDFSSNTSNPRYELLDYRRSRGYRVLDTGAGIKVQTLDLHGQGHVSVVRERELQSSEPVIVDVGLHRFVIQNWAALANGRKMKVKFLLVEKAMLLPLAIKTVRCEKAGHLCVKVTLDKFFVGILGPSILMEYDEQHRRLVRYFGPGPLTSVNGKVLSVEIDYRYKL